MRQSVVRFYSARGRRLYSATQVALGGQFAHVACLYA